MMDVSAFVKALKSRLTVAQQKILRQTRTRSLDLPRVKIKPPVGGFSISMLPRAVSARA